MPRGAHLEEKRGGKFKPLAHNQKAEEWVREMLLAYQPTVGLCMPEEWGLARALWCPQEHVAIDGSDGRALSSIQELSGKQDLGQNTLPPKGAIQDAFLEYWTDKGRPKGGKGARVWGRSQADLSSKEEELTEWEWEGRQSTQAAAQELEDEPLAAATR